MYIITVMLRYALFISFITLPDSSSFFMILKPLSIVLLMWGGAHLQHKFPSFPVTFLDFSFNIITYLFVACYIVGLLQIYMLCKKKSENKKSFEISTFTLPVQEFFAASCRVRSRNNDAYL